ncbi:hypothetical protein FXO37_00921 [Capsicum annuum]|nr:hypothetical protein FXO37_00921 [Capsicum annuum]
MEKNRRREGEWRQRAEAVGFHRPWLAEVCGAGTWREQAGGRYGLVVMLFDNGDGFARIKSSATIDADTSYELYCDGLVRTKASGAIDTNTSCELCCGSIPHSLCVWLNPNYVVKVKSLEKLLGDSEFQLSNYIASMKKSMRDSEHQLQHAVASAKASYGIRSICVDGNDDIDVFTIVLEARKIVVNEHKTVLVESRLQAKQNAGADKRYQYKGKGGFQMKH